MRPAPIAATLILVVALLAGPGLLVLGLIGLLARSRRRSRWVRTTGAVTDYSHTWAGGTDSVSSPGVEFRTADGQMVRGRQQFAVDVGWYPTGDVQVWYDPRDPQRFSSSRGWWDGVPVLLVIVGTVFTTFELIVYVAFG